MKYRCTIAQQRAKNVQHAKSFIEIKVYDLQCQIGENDVLHANWLHCTRVFLSLLFEDNFATVQNFELHPVSEHVKRT